MNPLPFNKPFIPDSLAGILAGYIKGIPIPGHDQVSRMAEGLLQDLIPSGMILLTSSCTHALEMAALLCDLQVGDEVILPSFTYVSAANAIVLRGAIPVFIDIRPDTLNMDERLIEAALTVKTRAIWPVHYGGVAAEMSTICEIAGARRLFVVEDAAHSIMSAYGGKHPGVMGDAGCISFDQSKNLHCYKGGALIVNREGWRERARIIFEKGTDRAAFDRGQVNQYSWIDTGSNYGLNLLSLIFLIEQLKSAREVTEKRQNLWRRYHQNLEHLRVQFGLGIPTVPMGVRSNAHVFYLMCRNQQERDQLIYFLASKGITAAFHYVPLHSSPAGKRMGRFHGADAFTSSCASRLIRLPLFHDLTPQQVDSVCTCIADFYSGHK